MPVLTSLVLSAMKLSWNPSSTAGVSYHVIVHEIEADAAGGDVHDHAHSTAAVSSACSARTEAAEGHAALLANTTETSVTITGLKNMEYAITVLVDLAGNSLCTRQACVLPGPLLQVDLACAQPWHPWSLSPSRRRRTARTLGHTR